MGINLNDPEIVTGGNFIPEGWHTITVISYKEGKSEKKQAPFVEYLFRDEEGRESRKRFFLGKSSLWVLKLLTIAAGMEGQHLAEFEFEDIIGKEIDVLFKKGEKYTEAGTEFAPPNTSANRPEKETAASTQAATAKAASTPKADEDDIPF